VALTSKSDRAASTSRGVHLICLGAWGKLCYSDVRAEAETLQPVIEDEDDSELVNGHLHHSLVFSLTLLSRPGPASYPRPTLPETPPLTLCKPSPMESHRRLGCSPMHSSKPSVWMGAYLIPQYHHLQLINCSSFYTSLPRIRLAALT
jgi:hypothetical protein